MRSGLGLLLSFDPWSTGMLLVYGSGLAVIVYAARSKLPDGKLKRVVVRVDDLTDFLTPGAFLAIAAALLLADGIWSGSVGHVVFGVIGVAFGLGYELRQRRRLRNGR